MLKKPEIGLSSAPNQRNHLSVKSRELVFAALTAGALNASACYNEEVDIEPRGANCVTILDHNDAVMDGCEFDYAPPDSEEVLNPCSEYSVGIEEPLFVYAAPGILTINAKCGTVSGYLKVPLRENQTDSMTSRLIGSFGTDRHEFVADPTHYEIKLNDHLCWNSADWCPTKLTNPELVRTEVVDVLLDCQGEEDECGQRRGSELLEALYDAPNSNSTPKHLTFTARVDKMANNESVALNILLKQKNNPIQQITVPVTINGPVCGNGIIETYERCDDKNFMDKSCKSFGFSGGDLTCTDDCQITTEKCTDN